MHTKHKKKHTQKTCPITGKTGKRCKLSKSNNVNQTATAESNVTWKAVCVYVCYYRVSTNPAKQISSRFPGDILILRRQAMYELSLTEHVMMSSDQRSSLCHPTNLLGLHESQLCHQHFAIFHEDQLNFSRFPVFPGAVDTLYYR